MTLDELLLNIHTVDFSSFLCQTEIQSEEEKSQYAAQGYNISYTEKEFKDRFEVDPSRIWYSPSVSCGCYYFNQDTLAVSPFYIDLVDSGMLFNMDSYFKAFEERETEVASNNYHGSLLSLPDGMRMEYFKLLIDKKGPNIPNLYNLFFSTYLESDYGFGNIDSQTLQTIISSKTAEDKQNIADKLKDFPDTIKVYRGGNTASTPADQAYSWTLDINIANFFACRRGSGDGYIVEGEISKTDVIDIFLDNRNEQEIIADPKNISITQTIPIHGIDLISSVLPEIAPMYQKFRDRMYALDFAQDSDEHGYGHEARVLLLSLTIAHLLELPSGDKKALATAAIYHDTQRTNDGIDAVHGQLSKQYYHNSVSSHDPVVEFLCEYHSLPDEAGYKEIMQNRKLSKNRAKSKLLFDIFKDADALDRVRFGLRDLDLNQLRLPISKQLSLVARLYLEQVRVQEKQLHRKASLNTQIQSASTRMNKNQSINQSQDKNSSFGR